MTLNLALVHAYLQSGEVQDALEALNAHLETDEDESALRLRAQVYLRLGDADSAIADYAEVSVLDEDDVIFYSVALERLGYLDEALRVLADHYSDSQTRLTERYIDVLLKSGDFDTAANLLRNWVDRAPGWSALAAQVAVRRGDFDGAVTYFTAAIDTLSAQAIPNTGIGAMVAGWLCGRAAAHQALGQLDAAMDDYTQAEDLIADDPLITFNRGLIVYQRGAVDDARTLIQRAWQAAPESLRARLQEALDADESLRRLVTL